MVRKAVFTREDIIKAGFDLVNKQGLDQLTARNLADEIGSSTAPVYSNFGNMDELHQALVKEAMDRLLVSTRNGESENKFLNIGLGILDFAYDYPRWYQALFLVKITDLGPGYELMEEFLKMMAEFPGLAKLDAAERLIVLKKMAFFTRGMATDICLGNGDYHSREEWRMLLEEVGETIYLDALQRPTRNAEELKILGSLCYSPESKNTQEEED